jgi:hypothetical protein
VKVLHSVIAEQQHMVGVAQAALLTTHQAAAHLLEHWL